MDQLWHHTNENHNIQILKKSSLASITFTVVSLKLVFSTLLRSTMVPSGSESKFKVEDNVFFPEKCLHQSGLLVLLSFSLLTFVNF